MPHNSLPPIRIGAPYSHYEEKTFTNGGKIMNASVSLEKSLVLLELGDVKAESTYLGIESGKTASLAVELSLAI